MLSRGRIKIIKIRMDRPFYVKEIYNVEELLSCVIIEMNREDARSRQISDQMGREKKQIKEFCNARLAEYKWVRIIEFTEEMPKTISGKIQKAVLRNQSERKQDDL